MSVRHSEYETIPGEKTCAHCGATYKRNPKYGRDQWRTSSFCSRKCANEETHTRHGAARRGTARSPLYSVWAGIKRRCCNPKSNVYAYYGGRGIEMCQRWHGSFELFAIDMGTPPSPRHEVGRIDNNGPYAPANVRWETRSENMRNTRLTRRVRYGGRDMCLKEASDAAGVPYKKAWRRYVRDGWPLERALTL